MVKNIFIISFLFSLTLLARAPKEYSLERSTTLLKTEGVSFKAFRDMKAEQIKPLEALRFTRTRGTEVSQLEAYVLMKLWESDNKIVTYKNNLVTMNFYKINNIIPENMEVINNEFARKEEYDSKKKEITEYDEVTILKWLKFVTGKNCKLEDRYPRLHFSLGMKFVNYNQPQDSYDFLITTPDKRFYYMHLKMRGGEHKDAERAMQSFMRYIKIDKVKEAKKSTFQSSKFKPSSKVSPEYQETIDAVKKQVLNTDGWWLAQTNNYVLKSNMPTKKRSFAKKVQEQVEFIRKVYEKFIPPVSEIKAVSIITIPNTKEEYLKYTGAPEWSAGVWMANRKELAVASYTRDEKQQMGTLRHEAFHQYIYYALDQKGSPPWFNEGHADLFASIKLLGSKVTIIEDPMHLRVLAPLMKRKGINIKKHLVMGHQAFYANPDLNYPVAWSIMYFLRKAVPLYKDKRYAEVLDKSIKSIVNGDDIQTVYDKAFAGVDIGSFENDFYQFWSSKSMRSRAQRNIIVPR